ASRAHEFEKAVDVALRRDSRDDAARHVYDHLVGLALLGRCANASAMSRQAQSWSHRRDVVWRAAVALALCGRGDEALAVGNDIARRYPKDTLINGISVPLIRGAVALQRGRSAEAINILQPALRYDFSWFGNGLPNYIRGLTFLGQHDGQNALAEFDKILSHRYLFSVETYYTLAQLGAARAAALTGDTALSRQHYQEFLNSWKNAEP